MDIEKIATNAVDTSISKTDRLETYIKAGEKEPVWDGPVYIHKDSKKTNKDLKKVFTQVKGKLFQGKIKDTIKYPVKVVDLEDYVHNGGAIFFVVYIDKKEREARQIYYAAITPFRASEILKNRTNKNTISVPFEKFPEDNNEKTIIFESFHTNANMQTSSAGKKTPTVEELQKQGVLESLTIKYQGFRTGQKNDIFPRIVDGREMYVYANVRGSSAPTPVEYYSNVSQITMSTDSSIPVFVGDTQYYDKINIVSTADKRIHKIGKCMTMSFPLDNKPSEEKQCTINIKLQGTLRERIRDLKFLIALFEKKSVKLGSAEFPIDFPKEQLDKIRASEYPDVLEGYIKLDNVLKKMSVKKDLELDKCTDSDNWKINVLVAAIEDDEPVHGLDEDLPIIVNLNICNLHFVMLCHKNDDGSRNVWDYFTTTVPVVMMDADKKPHPTSQFALMKAESFNTVDNINYESIVNDFRRLEPQDFLVDTANQLLLEMLKAYDIKKSDDLYKGMEDLMSWIKEHPENMTKEVIQLNELQLIARKRPLQYAEKKVLNGIIENTNEVFFKIGSFLLLDEQEEAKKLLDSLEEKDLNYFKEFPIYKFYKKTEEVHNNG